MRSPDDENISFRERPWMDVKLHFLPCKYDFNSYNNFTQRFSFFFTLKMRKVRFEDVKKLPQRQNVNLLLIVKEQRIVLASFEASNSVYLQITN